MQEISVSELVKRGILSEIVRDETKGSYVFNNARNTLKLSKIIILRSYTVYPYKQIYANVFYTCSSDMLLMVEYSKVHILADNQHSNRSSYQFMHLMDSMRCDINIIKALRQNEESFHLIFSVDPKIRSGATSLYCNSENALLSLLKFCVDYINTDGPSKTKLLNVHEMLNTLSHLDVISWSTRSDYAIKFENGIATLESIGGSISFEKIIENSMNQYIDYVLFEELNRATCAATLVNNHQSEFFHASEMVAEQAELLAEQINIDENL